MRTDWPLRFSCVAMAIATATLTTHPAALAQAPGTIVTVAGNGKEGTKDLGGLATAAQLHRPDFLAVDGTGDLFLAEWPESLVLKRSSDGILTRINVSPSIWSTPTGLALDSSGDLFVSEYSTSQVRVLHPDGSAPVVAGKGLDGFSGDGGPALLSTLAGARGIAIDAQGDLFIVDGQNRRVRRVSPAGVISTYAGGGKPAKGNGDGESATNAVLSDPTSVAVDTQGNVFIVDYGANRVRKVSLDGTITTAAGGGHASDGLGDGGPATQALLIAPFGAAVDSAGTLFITDAGHYRVRKVSADGTITTVAGTGLPGFSGDGGLATEARLSGPTGIAIDAAGNLLFADVSPDAYATTTTGNERIRKVISAATPGLLAGRPLVPPLGDIDGDGATTISDAVLALRIVIGALTPTDTQRRAADVNGDGNVDLRDVRLILLKAIGA